MWALGFADPKLSVNQMLDQKQNPSRLIQPYVIADTIKANPRRLTNVLSMTK